MGRGENPFHPLLSKKIWIKKKLPSYSCFRVVIPVMMIYISWLLPFLLFVLYSVFHIKAITPVTFSIRKTSLMASKK